MPLAPLGNGVAPGSGWTSPLRSVARTRQLWRPGRASQRQVPLAPVVDAGVGAELGLLPRVVVDADLDLLDAAVLRPGDTADDDAAGVEPVQRPRGVSMRDWVMIGASVAQPRSVQ